MKSNLYNLTLALAFLFPPICNAQTAQTDSLKRLLPVVKSDTAKANLYNKISNQFRESNPDSTAYYASVALAFSRKINFEEGIAESFLNTGNSLIILGKYKPALVEFSKAQALYHKLLAADDTNATLKKGLARSYASGGVVYSEQSNYFMALEMYQKALKLYVEIDNKNFISKAYNNIGIVYKSQVNYPKALEYLNKALKIQLENGEQAAAVTYTNIGAIYFEQNQDQKALESYILAKKQFEKGDNLRGFALLKNYLGDYYKREKQFGEAEKSYTESLGMYEKMQNKFGASLALYKLGQLAFDQKNFSAALPLTEKSLAYANEIGSLDQGFHSEQLLSEIYTALNSPDKALLHYKNYVSGRDSIAKMENAKKFAQTEMNFEYKKKEALLEEQNKRHTQLLLFGIFGTLLLLGLILVLYNRMQVKKRLTLQKEVAEYEQKALHLQMNPHFVFNCLSSISSFIVQNGTDSALKYLSKFSKLMRLTLEYSKDSLIPIDKEIESLQNYLELEQLRFHNIFKFTISASDNVEFNMGLPPLLIQPFVENAILHGIVPKETGGKVDVYFDVENDQLICTITDDGIGIEKSKELRQNSVTAHKSMALQITRKRLEIMESATSRAANIEITDRSAFGENGTKVSLKLPVQYIQ
ncbi:tetratricopeptide repeat-containing sensor histidine kinase [Flavobacterium silvaticum]|uniref:Tetratricopeptide repeat protein n=1 Tax=Flavobacterium silvaticum TaxID=1852020 RepID=A0A972FV03_9FLAO|nr:tetratricopeptide repeat protein [Flavobacterium silvaticum]NMH28115.1 tetratricopeptide repeat protein [Flavobacterium silvaticum]